MHKAKTRNREEGKGVEMLHAQRVGLGGKGEGKNIWKVGMLCRARERRRAEIKEAQERVMLRSRRAGKVMSLEWEVMVKGEGCAGGCCCR